MERGSGQYDRVGRHNSVPSTDTPKFQILAPSHKTPKTKTKLHYLMEQLTMRVTWE